MDNKLMTFENAAFGKIRTLTIDGEPWFVAVDVCRALEIGKPFLCLATNSPAFFPASALFSAAFFVISDALTVFAVPRPAFAAAYSRLIARFCCQREYGLEEKPPFCCSNS